jgi:hypothetical protein
VHLFAQLGDQVQSLGDQQVLGQWLREIAFVAKKLAHQAFHQLGNRMPIIDIARGQAKGQDLTLIVDDQVQLEAVEPAHRGLATSSTPVKDAMGVNASVMADGKRGGIDEADARTLTQLRVQIGAPVGQGLWASPRQNAHSSPRWETRCANDGGHTRCSRL